MLILIILSLGNCIADDPILESVVKARATFKQKLENAGSEFELAFDEAIKKVASSGDLETVTKVKQEKDDFIATRSLPISAQMSRAKDVYISSVAAAETEYGDALKNAKKEYTKKLDLTNAKAIDKELTQHAAAVKTKFNNDSFFQTGTEWKGIKYDSTPKGVRKEIMRIFVRKRDGDTVVYEHWVDNGERCMLFEGSVTSGEINARCTDFVKGRFSRDTLGSINITKVQGKRLIQEGRDAKGKPYIYLELKLLEESK